MLSLFSLLMRGRRKLNPECGDRREGSEGDSLTDEAVT